MKPGTQQLVNDGCVSIKNISWNKQFENISINRNHCYIMINSELSLFWFSGDKITDLPKEINNLSSLMFSYRLQQGEISKHFLSILIYFNEEWQSIKALFVLFWFTYLTVLCSYVDQRQKTSWEVSAYDCFAGNPEKVQIDKQMWTTDSWNKGVRQI